MLSLFKNDIGQMKMMKADSRNILGCLMKNRTPNPLLIDVPAKK